MVFACGLAAGMLDLFPSQLVRHGIKAARDWASNAEHYARIRPDKHLRPARFPGNGVTILKADRVWPGNTLIAGMWGEQLGFRLVNMDGEILRQWFVSFNAIWPEAKHLKIQPHDWDTNIHGFVVYPNGDIVFNFEHNGTVAIDACANVRWKLSRETHHDIYRTKSGNLWVLDSQLITEKDSRFPLLSPPFYEEFLLELSPGGEILREISLLDVMKASGYEGLLVGPAENIAGPNGTGTVEKRLADITHLNDIDILEGELAESFPLFAEGDMLLSLRNLDLLIVVDGQTEKIKWSMAGPWLMQHDPDFVKGGKIMVYDNRARRWGMPREAGSRILEVDPVTRNIRVVYEGSDDRMFFSSQMGRQQPLPNGNVLASEPDGGRLFEIDQRGEIVWEYINRWSEDKVAAVTQARRLDENFFQELPASCENVTD